MAVRILMLDDHVVVREALAALIATQPGLTVIGQVGTVRELQLALRSVEFDLLLADLQLPGPSGVSAVAEMQRVRPGRRSLVLTLYADAQRAAEAFAAGADGYALKQESASAILQAIGDVMAGRRYLSPLVDATTVTYLLGQKRSHALAAGPLAPLSPREREVFDLLVRGHSCTEIARLLFISARTADTHRSHIFDKLGIHSTVELVRFAARFGLLDPEQAAG